jgi:hypothetical protein
MMYVIEMASGVIIYIPSFMTIIARIQVITSTVWEAAKVGIINRSDSQSTLLK